MKPSRWIAIATGLAAIVVLFLALRPGGDEDGPSPTPSPTATESPTAEPTETGGPSPTEPAETGSPTPVAEPNVIEIEILVQDGEVKGPRELEVTQGKRIQLEVSADVTDEVHVHGYDLFGDVTPEQPAVIVFRADATGVYEVELEGAGLVLLELSVVP